jgi:hypothetical protein
MNNPLTAEQLKNLHDKADGKFSDSDEYAAFGTAVDDNFERR